MGRGRGGGRLSKDREGWMAEGGGGWADGGGERGGAASRTGRKDMLGTGSQLRYLVAKGK